MALQKRLNRQAKRGRKKARKKAIRAGEDPYPVPDRTPRTLTASKGGSIRAKLSSGGPVAKPN
mgnify:CR=1 FL=1|tara:strand:+ start:78 stop:266 length:189 start_codon:yes stop_codon:yes gene_type:complete